MPGCVVRICRQLRTQSILDDPRNPYAYQSDVSVIEKRHTSLSISDRPLQAIIIRFLGAAASRLRRWQRLACKGVSQSKARPERRRRLGELTAALKESI